MRFSQATRNNFAAQSSGASYPTKSEAIRRFDGQLPNSTTLRSSDLNRMLGDDGQVLAEIVKVDDDNYETDEVVGRALITWHRLSTGRWEIIGYIA